MTKSLECLGEFGDSLVDHCHQQSAEVSEVILHNAPGEAGALGDAPHAGCCEAFVEDVAHPFRR